MSASLVTYRKEFQRHLKMAVSQKHKMDFLRLPNKDSGLLNVIKWIETIWNIKIIRKLLATAIQRAPRDVQKSQRLSVSELTVKSCSMDQSVLNRANKDFRRK